MIPTFLHPNSITLSYHPFLFFTCTQFSCTCYLFTVFHSSSAPTHINYQLVLANLMFMLVVSFRKMWTTIIPVSKICLEGLNEVTQVIQLGQYLAHYKLEKHLLLHKRMNRWIKRNLLLTENHIFQKSYALYIVQNLYISSQLLLFILSQLRVYSIQNDDKGKTVKLFLFLQ